jgi:ABC-2 type transport system permease protein
MLSNIFLKTLRDRRRSLLFWGLGLTALAAIMVAFFPTIRDNPVIQDYIESIPADLVALFGGEIIDYSSAEGYLSSELFFLMYPLLMLVLGIGFGASATASEEEAGTLDMLLANPVPRWRLVLEKFGAMTVFVLEAALIFWAVLLLAGLTVDMDLSPARLGAVCFSGALLGIMHGALALAVGAARGRRGIAIAAAGAVGAYGYLLNALAPLMDWLEPFQKLSPFYYYTAADPISNGMDWGHGGLLIGLAALFLAVALVTFQRRDLAV